jgi:hypothetical protein
VTVKAAYRKNKHAADQPLPRDLTEALAVTGTDPLRLDQTRRVSRPPG